MSNKLHDILYEIGLTASEAKVYIALLENSPAQTGILIKKTQVAPSKIYSLLDKLAEKGLVSHFVQNKIKQYKAAPVEELLEYLQRKRNQLEEQEQELKEVLENISINKSESIPIGEVFTGWNGMRTVYDEIRRTLKKGDISYVIGASAGENTEQTEKFFREHVRKLVKAGITNKVLFNERARPYVSRIEKEGKFKYTKKFLPMNTPVEINISGPNVAIVRLKKDPLVFFIRDKETADSFIQYFNAMWQIGIN